DLIPLFDSAQGSRVIVGGDLNVSTATTDEYYLRRSTGLLSALTSLGLVDVMEAASRRPETLPDCPCGARGSCRHVATWKRVDLDGLFVRPSLAKQVREVSVLQAAVDEGLSDHAPLAVDLELSPEPAARQWDAPTIAAEIGRRHGPAAEQVVQQLLTWAEDK